MDTSKKIKLGVRIAALLLMVIFFMPTISVSCSGYASTEMSAFDAVTGDYGEYDLGDLSDVLGTTSMTSTASPESAYLLLVLPILAILILIFANSKAILSAICAAGSAIGMLLFKSGVEKEIDDMMGLMGGYGSYGKGLVSVKGTTWFTVHMVVCVAIVGVLMIEKFVLQNPQNKQKVANMFGNANNGPQQGYGAPQQGYGAPQQGYGAPQGYAPQNNAPVCAQCGAPLTPGTKFCARCGAPAPAPAPQNVEKFCSACGTKCAPGTAFCPTCGNKMN